MSSGSADAKNIAIKMISQITTTALRNARYGILATDNSFTPNSKVLRAIAKMQM